MKKKYGRSKFTINLLKTVRILICIMGIILCLFPFYLVQLSKFNLAEDFYYFIIFPGMGLLFPVPLLIIISKSLKEISSQYLLISENFIEMKIYNVIHNMQYDKITKVDKIGKSYIISSDNDYIIIGNFEKMNEINQILNKKIKLKTINS